MTREYARVKLAIWADTDFRSLTDGAQALYFRLLSSPTMGLCGVADWRPNRLAALTNEMTAEQVKVNADELRSKGYIVTDEETEEVLIRSFVRHDGLIKTPNIAAAMCKDYAGTASATLRGVIVYELNRLHDDDPSMKGWSVASRLLSNPSVNPSLMPSGMPSPNPSGMALANGSSNGCDIPHPSSLIPHPSKEKEPRKRGHRLDKDWQPDPSVRDEMAKRFPYVDMRLAHEKFVNYWTDKAGQAATKLDWTQTWRNWIIAEAERTPNGHRVPTSSASSGPPLEILGDMVKLTAWYEAQNRKSAS